MSAKGDDNDGTIADMQDGFEDTAHQGCYLFEPSRTRAELPVERPAKRRKINQSTNRADLQTQAFPSLFHGKESPTSAQTRSDLFHEFWSHQKEAIDRVVRDVDASVLADIVHFVKQTPPDGLHSRIPTGLVLTGPSHSIQGRLLEYWRANQLSQAAEEVITLDSSQVPNLITALKNIVRAVVVQRKGLDWYQSFLSEHKRLIPMNYDLELLQIFVEREGLTKIVISILDAEAFDEDILSDLMSAVSSWIDRLPLVVLFGIATTTELFEARLPKRIISLLQGTVFDISTKIDSLYKIYQTVQDDPDTKLWLGPALSKILLERSKDQDESPEGFARSTRYIYMSHFFANPLSVLLADGRSNELPATQDLCNAIRNTESFRTYAEILLRAREAAAVKRLFADDEHLLNETKTAITDGQWAMSEYREAIRFFGKIYCFLQPTTNATLTPFEIDNKVFSGTAFLNSALYNDTLASIEKLPSDTLANLLNQCALPDSVVDFSTATALSKLSTLHETSSGKPIRSAYDPKHTTTTTTISRNNTVSLAKHAPKLSTLEKDYTALVQAVHDAMDAYFESRIIDVDKLFMNEAFVSDLKMPLATTFTPRPRHGVERALDRPGDYLGSGCCSAADGQLPEEEEEEEEDMRSGRLPPTSLLWQLWCEAGSVVNVRDLWDAFRSAIVDREVEDEEDDDNGEEPRTRDEMDDGTRTGTGIDERMALALFYRSLAELRMLGFVKPTKKKVDCLAKAVWRGL